MWWYLVPRIGWNYEEVDGKKVYGTEDLSVGNFYGLYYLNIRWRSAQDGRTPMLSVLVRLFNRWNLGGYIINPKD